MPTPETPGTLPARDPLSAALVIVSFLLVVGWFVWSLLNPPVLRVRPELRADPIPPNFAEPGPRRGSLPAGRPSLPPGIAYPMRSPPLTPPERLGR